MTTRAAADSNPYAAGPTGRPDVPSITSIPSEAWLTRDSLTLAAILGVALALRIPGLLESLWFDELWSTRVKVGTFDTLIRTIATDVHPPLYLALMFGWVRLFG